MERKTEMANIVIYDVGPKKLEAIRIIRYYTGAGLSEAKQFVEAAGSGDTVEIVSVPQKQAQMIANEMQAIGATLQISDGSTGSGSTRQLTYRTPPATSTPVPAAAPVSSPAAPAPAAQVAAPKVSKAENLSPTRYQARPTGVSVRTDGTLKDYLRAVSSLEVQAYNQSRLMDSLNGKIRRLGKFRDLKEPKKPHLSLDGLENKNIITVLGFAGTVTCGVLCFLIFGIFFGLKEIIPFSLLGLLISVPIMLTPDYFRYKRALKWYENELAAFNQEKAQDDARVKQELRAKKEIELQLKCVREEYNRTVGALNAAYRVNIIHPDYRNMVAMCSLFDYFDKGICTSLHGHEGAYKFYEEALRFGKIIDKLDIIISKLDEIAENQRWMGCLIREGNRMLYRIEQNNAYLASTMDQIRENTALTEYNTRCAAQSAAVLENIEFYRWIKYD